MNTRDTALTLARTNGTVTAHELSDATGARPRTAREWLQRLESEGELEYVGQEPRSTLGRPFALFAISSKPKPEPPAWVQELRESDPNSEKHQ